MDLISQHVNLIIVSLLLSIIICIISIDSILSTKNCMSSTTNSSGKTSKTADFRIKYKTQKCRYLYDQGYCPYNQFCAFAHDQSELRDKSFVNLNYKTKYCHNFKKHGYCKYGERCQFLHIQEAPVSLGQRQWFNPEIKSTYSEKISKVTNSLIDDKHEKQLLMLKQYGVELLNLKKSCKRSPNWKVFIQNGIDPEEQEEDDLMDFEGYFPDYNFKKKPRLFSL